MLLKKRLKTLILTSKRGGSKYYGAHNCVVSTMMAITKPYLFTKQNVLLFKLCHKRLENQQNYNSICCQEIHVIIRTGKGSYASVPVMIIASYDNAPPHKMKPSRDTLEALRC